MSNCNTRRVSAAALLICLMVARSSGQQAEISSELARLREKLSSLKLNFDEDKTALAAQITRAEEALRAGRLLATLYGLQSLWTRMAAHEYVNSKAAILKQGKDGFESDWRNLGKELADKERRLAPANLNRQPAAVRAFVQAARHQSRVFYQSGRLYGLETTLPAGHYYMGLARGYADYSLLCLALRFKVASKNPVLRAVTGDIAQLETEILNAYKQSDPKDQPKYNNLNSTLKLATELDRSRMLEGALQQYLEASLLLGLITAPAVSKDDLPAIKERIETIRQRLAAGDRDHSIGLLYLERAETALAPSDGEVNAESLRRATVILEQVLSRYFNYVSEVNG